MKTQKGLYIKLPGDGYKVEARDMTGTPFEMSAAGFYLTWNRARGRVFMNYAGEQSGDTYSCIEMPLDADFLKQMAKDLKKLAKRIEDGDV